MYALWLIGAWACDGAGTVGSEVVSRRGGEVIYGIWSGRRSKRRRNHVHGMKRFSKILLKQDMRS